MTRFPKLSTAQFDIMSVVWDKEETTITEVLNEINSSRAKKLRRTTIQVQMTRLKKKGWLAHRKEGRTFYFQAVPRREDAQAEIVTEVVDSVFGGSCADLVKCLLSLGRISPDEVGRIRELLDRSPRSKPGTR